MTLLMFGLPSWADKGIWGLVGLLVLLFFSKMIFGWVFIGESHNGIPVKKWAVGGKGRLPEGRIIATKGEAGIQAKMIGPGIHFGYWPWMYSVMKQPLLEVPTGQIGIVEAIDGAELPSGAILAGNVTECNSFQDAAKFIEGGGQKGWQRNFLTPGQYRINQQVFRVKMEAAKNISSNKIGLVTTLDGKPLEKDMIAGPELRVDHAHFQNANAFLNGGGYRGLQELVLLPGNWYINPMFAVVEEIDMTEIPIGYVGVINSFIGNKGVDTSGEGFKHGNIVSKGEKGIWNETYDPGRYAFNTRLMRVEMVPTTNIVLNWADKQELHGLDNGLDTINLRSRDGFTFELDVTQVVNIPNTAAPKVIARFGSMVNMVSQVLETTVGSYFRNSAQTSDALDFVDHRKERQSEAKAHINAILSEYDVVGVDTLIGDIEPPKQLMEILSERKVAEQQQAMFTMRMQSEQKRQEFVKAETAANKEADLTTAEYDKLIATKSADAKIERAKGDKQSAMIEADGKAYVFKTVGAAQAGNITDVGGAEAGVIELKTRAMGTQQFALVQIFEALAKAGTPLVPQILVQGGGESGGNSGLLEALIGNEMLKDLRNKIPESPKKGPDTPDAPNAPAAQQTPPPVANAGDGETKS